jgi:hypothetical protein
MLVDFAAARAPGWSEQETARTVIGKQRKQDVKLASRANSLLSKAISVCCATAAFRPVTDAG